MENIGLRIDGNRRGKEKVWSGQENEWNGIRYLPYNQCNSNARWSQVLTCCWIQTFVRWVYEEECWGGSLDFSLREKRQSNSNDRIDDFLKAYTLRKKEHVQKFNTSMRMRHTLRIENCLVLCKYKDVVQTFTVLNAALSVIKSPDIFSSIIKYLL